MNLSYRELSKGDDLGNRLETLRDLSSSQIQICNITNIATVFKMKIETEKEYMEGNLWIFPQCYVMYTFLFLSMLYIVYIVYMCMYVLNMRYF